MYPDFSFRNQENTYVVKKGDSLYSIAKKLNITVNDLMSLNDLDNTLLTVGQTLVTKKDNHELKHVGSDICATYIDKETSVEPVYDIYIVKKGDSLYSIAKKYQTTVANLIYLNDLKNNLLSVNQELKVPHSIESITYSVKKGDTLYSIASNYGVTPRQLINLNNLTTTTLQIGQILKIPTATNIATKEKTVYTVKKGDSLYSIAKNYHTTVTELKEKNNLISDVLHIGQTLIIPT